MMSREAYHIYLASREWAVLRERVRERSRGRCERCVLGRHEETHHVSYARVGSEHLSDLLGVCSRCHMFLSAKATWDPCIESGMRQVERPEVCSMPVVVCISDHADRVYSWRPALCPDVVTLCWGCLLQELDNLGAQLASAGFGR